MPTATIIGSGPNGLSAAIVLAASGVKTTVLERNGQIGGGCSTAEVMHDEEAARKSYEDFLALWKNADPDLPYISEPKRSTLSYARRRSSVPLHDIGSSPAQPPELASNVGSTCTVSGFYVHLHWSISKQKPTYRY